MPKTFQISLFTCAKALFPDAGTKDSLASRADASSSDSWHLFCHKRNLQKAQSFWRNKSVARVASRTVDGGGRIWLAIGGMGSF
jgi:hypothetical protein